MAINYQFDVCTFFDYSNTIHAFRAITTFLQSKLDWPYSRGVTFGDKVGDSAYSNRSNRDMHT